MAIVIGILVIVGILWFVKRQADADGGADLTSEEELLRLCLGDRKRAERLMAREEENSPGISRMEAARRAAHAMKRDLR